MNAVCAGENTAHLLLTEPCLYLNLKSASHCIPSIKAQYPVCLHLWCLCYLVCTLNSFPRLELLYLGDVLVNLLSSPERLTQLPLKTQLWRITREIKALSELYGK